MRGIIDKLILLFFGLVLLLTTEPAIKPIILLLCVFIALTVEELFSSPTFSYGLFGLGVLLSIFLPDLLFQKFFKHCQTCMPPVKSKTFFQKNHHSLLKKEC